MLVPGEILPSRALLPTCFEKTGPTSQFATLSSIVRPTSHFLQFTDSTFVSLLSREHKIALSLQENRLMSIQTQTKIGQECDRHQLRSFGGNSYPYTAPNGSNWVLNRVWMNPVRTGLSRYLQIEAALFGSDMPESGSRHNPIEQCSQVSSIVRPTSHFVQFTDSTCSHAVIERA